MSAAPGGWETWNWDESLFAGAAGYYEQGREPYAPGLADAFARGLALDGRGRLLDVGCGPGTVTLRLAPLFEAAVGLDPDPGMLACASQAAARQGIANVTWERRRAEELPAGLGGFRAVTFAASFHWMDRPRVAAAVAAMLDPGGAVVHVDAPGYRPEELAAEAARGSLPFPPPPDEALDQLRRQYLGSDRRAGQGIRNTSPDGEDQVFQEAGFRPAQTVAVPDQRLIERTADDIVARVFSASSTAPHLFGERRDDFERDMREILTQASPAGRFSLRLPDNRLRIWRLPALSGRATRTCSARRADCERAVQGPGEAARSPALPPLPAATCAPDGWPACLNFLLLSQSDDGPAGGGDLAGPDDARSRRLAARGRRGRRVGRPGRRAGGRRAGGRRAGGRRRVPRRRPADLEAADGREAASAREAAGMTDGELDPVIHVPARLRIMVTLATLAEGDHLSFPRLQRLLDLTPGNLITHLRKLEGAGYVRSAKADGQSALRLTSAGRAALDRYTENLRRLLDQASPPDAR